MPAAAVPCLFRTHRGVPIQCHFRYATTIGGQAAVRSGPLYEVVVDVLDANPFARLTRPAVLAAWVLPLVLLVPCRDAMAIPIRVDWTAEIGGTSNGVPTSVSADGSSGGFQVTAPGQQFDLQNANLTANVGVSTFFQESPRPRNAAAFQLDTFTAGSLVPLPSCVQPGNRGECLGRLGWERKWPVRVTASAIFGSLTEVLRELQT